MAILSFELSVFAIHRKIDFMNMVKLGFEFFVLKDHWDGWDLVDKFRGLMFFGLWVDFELFLVEENFVSKILGFSLEPDYLSLLISVFDS